MTAALLSIIAALGVHLVAARRQVQRGGPRFGSVRAALRRLSSTTATGEVAAACAALAGIGGFLGYLVFAGPTAAATVAVLFASLPIGAHRHRAALRLQVAQEAWPAMIEDIRVQTSTLGRSIPQALFEVGARAPAALRPAFSAARHEWLLTTDFERTVSILKAELADATADATLETLVVAHDLGAADLQPRLAALAEDRRQDVQGRKDARSRLAGARFARRFVLLVPAGMAVSGMSIGDGRAAYASPAGQTVVVVAVAMVAACWWWAGAVMRIPGADRVFGD